MQTRTIKKKIHIAYDTVEEFRKYLPKVPLVENWKDGQEGDYVKTDDNQVVQILRRGTLNSTEGFKRDYVRTIIGSFRCSDDQRMEGEMRENMYAFGQAGHKNAFHLLQERKKTTTREFLFGKYVAKGDGISDAYMTAFKTKNPIYAERMGKILLNQKRIQNVIREEIDKVLNEADITPLYILGTMKEIIDDPGAKDSDKVSLLKELVAVSGMKDTDKRSESVTVFQGFTDKQLEAIGGGETKRLAEAKREVER